MSTPSSIDDQQQQQQAVDGMDQQDRDATEDALAAILAAAFIAWLLPGPPTFFGNTTVARKRQLEAAISAPLRAYIQRTAADLAAASGLSNASVIAAETSDAVYARVLRDVLTRMDQSYRNLSDSLSHVSPLDIDQHARELAQDAGQRMGTSTATYAANDIRQSTAERLGAVWKQWVSRHDDRVRSTHQDLDGQQVPMDGAFISPSGAVLKFPGDPEAPISETAGCRCHLRFRTQPKERPFVV